MNSDQNIQRQIVSVSAKRKAIEDNNEKPSKIVCTVIRSIPQSEALQVSDLHNIKLNIYNAKRKKFPPLPKSGEEVQNMLNNIQYLI
ncbi:MULE domain-containing protein [Aphis craccivora]|uniref:MULE domain-containing protein n=1 Tax=Aphis craccivora TaxID=307492 RepID=A0A6G0YYQ3_APHCR|nr:MULE domain-containing protein [Aphis craccivora]